MTVREAYEYALIECNKLKAPAMLLEDFVNQLYFPNIENKLREGAISSRIAMLTLIDIIYIYMIQEDLDKRVENLYAYVSLNRDINKKSYEFIDMREELNKVYREYQPICSNLELEILKLSDSKFNEMMKNKNISTKYGMHGCPKAAHLQEFVYRLI